MTADAGPVAGWYGKIPLLGDFASRRLSQTFVATWDGWLQQSMTASRDALGQRWLDTYMNSPVWRFVLMPGVIGDTLWGGVMMPSVDKVGRHFPLTIAVAQPARAGSISAFLGARDWYGDLEETALATLNVDFELQRFEAHLASLPFPPVADEARDSPITALAGWWWASSGHHEMAIPPGHDMQRLMTMAAMHGFESAANGKSLWWREADTSGPIQLACFSGLPQPAYFSALLRGTAPPTSAAMPVRGDAASAPQSRRA